MPEWWEFPLTAGFGPTDEPLDSPYGGYAHFNKGLDHAVPMGTPIKALVGGTVVAAGPGTEGWGTRVWIKDADGNIHNYGHLSGVNVSVGDTIEPGAVVGASGSTGKSTGPHLSYDVWTPSGEYINPAPFVGGGGGRAMAAPGQTPPITAEQILEEIRKSRAGGTPAAGATPTGEQKAPYSTLSDTELRQYWRAGVITEEQWKAALVAKGDSDFDAQAKIARNQNVGLSTAAATKGQLTASEAAAVEAIKKVSASAKLDSWESPSQAAKGLSSISGEATGQPAAPATAGGARPSQAQIAQFLRDANGDEGELGARKEGLTAFLAGQEVAPEWLEAWEASARKVPTSAAPTGTAAKSAAVGPKGPNGEPGRTYAQITGTDYKSQEERDWYWAQQGGKPPAAGAPAKSTANPTASAPTTKAASASGTANPTTVKAPPAGPFDADRFLTVGEPVTNAPVSGDSMYVPSSVPMGKEFEFGTKGFANVPREGVDAMGKPLPDLIQKGGVSIDPTMLNNRGYVAATLGFDPSQFSEEALKPIYARLGLKVPELTPPGGTTDDSVKGISGTAFRQQQAEEEDLRNFYIPGFKAGGSIDIENTNAYYDDPGVGATSAGVTRWDGNPWIFELPALPPGPTARADQPAYLSYGNGAFGMPSLERALKAAGAPPALIAAGVGGIMRLPESMRSRILGPMARDYFSKEVTYQPAYSDPRSQMYEGSLISMWNDVLENNRGMQTASAAQRTPISMDASGVYRQPGMESRGTFQQPGSPSDFEAGFAPVDPNAGPDLPQAPRPPGTPPTPVVSPYTGPVQLGTDAYRELGISNQQEWPPKFGYGGAMTTQEPIVGVGAQTGQPQFVVGEAGPERLDVTPLSGPNAGNYAGGVQQPQMRTESGYEGMADYGAMMSAPYKTRRPVPLLDPVAALRRMRTAA